MKSSFKVPHTLVILFSMVVIAQILTYVIPAGSFDRVENDVGRLMVVSGSFHLTPDVEPLPIWASITAVPRGFTAANEIIFFALIIGGTFAVLRSSGAVDSGMRSLLKRWGDRPFLLIAGSITIFALGSSTIGFGEEYYPFVPVLITLCIALGYDRVTAVGIILVGYGAGFGSAFFNPFTTIVAQDIAGLPIGSGMGYRLILSVIFVAIGIHHVWVYAKKVKLDPSASYVADIDFPSEVPQENVEDLTSRHKWILTSVGIAILLMIYGLIEKGWYLTEMGGVFIALTITIALIARIKPDDAAISFGVGAASLTSVALLIGVARAIQIVLDDGGVVDTMIHGISVPLQELPSTVSAVGMFVVQTIANFFIPSGSGQAYVTMPVMAPLADIVGVSRQVAVLAFQFGDGFSNIFIPTQYVLLGMLAMGGVPYDRWLKFIMPFMIKVWVVGSLALVVAVLIGYS